MLCEHMFDQLRLEHVKYDRLDHLQFLRIDSVCSKLFLSESLQFTADFSGIMVLASLLLSAALAITPYIAHAVPLEANANPLEPRAVAVCSSGIYGELAPLLAPYGIAQAFCTAKYPVPCKKAKRHLVPRATTTTAAAPNAKVTAANPTVSAWVGVASNANNRSGHQTGLLYCYSPSLL